MHRIKIVCCTYVCEDGWGELELMLVQAMQLQLLRKEMSLCYLRLLLHSVSSHFNHLTERRMESRREEEDMKVCRIKGYCTCLHAVKERAGNLCTVVSSCNEQDLREVKWNIQITVSHNSSGRKHSIEHKALVTF